MKPAKATLALIAVLAGIMASEPVLAKGGGGKSGGGKSSSGKSSGGHSHARHSAPARAVVVVGSTAFLHGPGYFYPPYAPMLAVQPAPVGYIEQGADFYFCADAQKSYPDVEECAGGWQLITPLPTPGT